MKIVTDSSSLFSPEEGEELGITVTPACAVIDGEVYRDYLDIDSEEFLRRIEAGAVPTSSQLAIGDVLDVFEGCDEEILYLSIGAGLSGTYQNAVGAKNSIDDNDHIRVVDDGFVDDGCRIGHLYGADRRSAPEEYREDGAR